MRMPYEELVKQIEKAPATWLVGLLMATVTACVKSKCFVPGGLEKAVAKKIFDLNNPKGGLPS